MMDSVRKTKMIDGHTVHHIPTQAGFGFQNTFLSVDTFTIVPQDSEVQPVNVRQNCEQLGEKRDSFVARVGRERFVALDRKRRDSSGKKTYL